MSYDAALVLVKALNKENNPTRNSLQSTLSERSKRPEVNDGASGKIIFDKNGNRIGLQGVLVKLNRINPDKKDENALEFQRISNLDSK